MYTGQHDIFCKATDHYWLNKEIFENSYTELKIKSNYWVDIVPFSYPK